LVETVVQKQAAPAERLGKDESGRASIGVPIFRLRLTGTRRLSRHGHNDVVGTEHRERGVTRAINLCVASSLLPANK
jgi:hypothetical protein